jgi:hypothetical protein
MVGGHLDERRPLGAVLVDDLLDQRQDLVEVGLAHLLERLLDIHGTLLVVSIDRGRARRPPGGGRSMRRQSTTGSEPGQRGVAARRFAQLTPTGSS